MELSTEHQLFKDKTRWRGEHAHYQLPNGICVEVMRNVLTLGGDQGLWEVHYPDADGEIVNEGYCTTSEVNEILKELRGRSLKSERN